VSNQSEQSIQKSIIDLLRLKHFVVFKHHSTGFTQRDGNPIYFKYGEKGIADIIACSPTGRFWTIEVKKPGGKLSNDQIVFLNRVRGNGGIAIVAHSIDDVIDLLFRESLALALSLRQSLFLL
jgi:hypothetical protein